MVAAIRTAGLAKSFGATVALRPLDLEVAEGEVLGYLGPNGAGKTTTIRCLLGMERASAGRAEIFGVDAQAHPAEAHRRVGYVPGEANLWPGLTGGEALHLLGRVQGRVDEAYRDELTGRFRLDPSKRVRAYSKGNRQKVLLVAALSSRADLLILDEPTTGLDPLMEETFRECVAEARRRGQAVFLSSHILSEVEALSDRVAILRAGELVEVGTLLRNRSRSCRSSCSSLRPPGRRSSWPGGGTSARPSSRAARLPKPGPGCSAVPPRWSSGLNGGSLWPGPAGSRCWPWSSAWSPGPPRRGTSGSRCPSRSSAASAATRPAPPPGWDMSSCGLPRSSPSPPPPRSHMKRPVKLLQVLRLVRAWFDRFVVVSVRVRGRAGLASCPG